ncbi:peptidoglycan endopeptidase [Pediococcus ethanolidurans]|nr:peptidoglycan endopeptidase [Pediococcus ethanolidurans]
MKSHSNSKTAKVVLAGVAGAAGLFVAGATQSVNADSVNVGKNDTVWGISQKYNVSIKSIETLNKINQKSHLIFVGQKVEIPGTTKATKSDSQKYIKVTVKSGDSLWLIAQEKGTSVAALKEANGLNGNLILVGQVLKAPASDSSSAKTSSDATVQYKGASSAAQSSAASTTTPSSASSSTSSNTAAVASTSSSSATTASDSTVAGSTSSESSSVAVSSAASSESNSETTSASSTVSASSTSSRQASSSAVSSVASESSSSASSATPKSSAAVTVTTAYSTKSTQASSVAQSSSAPKSVASVASSSSKTTASSASTSKTTSTTTSSTLTSGSVVSLAVKLANANIPYVWGGESLSRMDCSGLVAYVYEHSEGISLPHNTVAQEGYVTTKSVSAAKPGDILFWGSKGATYHDAIYIGNNQYVAAPQPGQNVDIETISSYFAPSFAGTVK